MTTRIEDDLNARDILENDRIYQLSLALAGKSPDAVNRSIDALRRRGELTKDDALRLAAQVCANRVAGVANAVLREHFPEMLTMIGTGSGERHRTERRPRNPLAPPRPKRPKPMADTI